MARVMYRQGDLLFVKVDRLPKRGLVRVYDDVIVRGEATGHAHRLVGGELYRAGDTMYIVVRSVARVVHEEHAPIVLERGFWKVVRQREYSPDRYTTRGLEWVYVRD